MSFPKEQNHGGNYKNDILHLLPLDTERTHMPGGGGGGGRC